MRWSSRVGDLANSLVVVWAYTPACSLRRLRANLSGSNPYTTPVDVNREYATRYDLCKAFEEAVKTNDPLYHDFLLELNFLEELGSLQKHGGISLGWIRSTMGNVVIDRWTLWEPSIDHLRNLGGSPPGHSTYFENFQSLKDRLSNTQASHRFRRWLASIIEP